jgi:hypothetical protein
MEPTLRDILCPTNLVPKKNWARRTYPKEAVELCYVAKKERDLFFFVLTLFFLTDLYFLRVQK